MELGKCCHEFSDPQTFADVGQTCCLFQGCLSNSLSTKVHGTAS